MVKERISIIFLLSLMLLLAPRPTAARTALYLVGKANFIRSSGSPSDYVPGRADFCLAAAHQTYGAAMGLRLGLGKLIFIELEGQYNKAGKTVLTDPSDADTVKIDTYASIAGLGFLGIRVIQSARFDLSIIGGGGLYQLASPKTKSYLSKAGFETIIETPQKKNGAAWSAGLFIHYYFLGKVGLICSGRYTSISFDKPRKSVDILLGLAFAFH